jgi:hypothetical protein
MANSYTTKLIKRMPAPGDFDWDDEWHDNEKIDDFLAGSQLSQNMMIAGGAISDGTGLAVDYTTMVVMVAGVRYEIAGSSVALTASSLNYVYVNSSGTVVASTTVPTGDYVPLALVDTDATTPALTGDVRPWAQAVRPGENIFINGDFGIDQANAGAAVPVSTTAKYFVDMCECTGANHSAVVNAQQVAGFAGFSKAGQLTVTTADTLASGEYGHGFRKFVEFKDCQLIAGRYLAFKFPFKAKITGTYSVALLSGDFSNSYVTTFSYGTAEAVQTVPMLVPVPSAKVIEGSNNRGLVLLVGVAAVGAKATSTLDQWQAGEYYSAAGATDWETTVGNYIAMTGLYGGVDLIPAEFPHRPAGDELKLCERYYRKSYDLGTAPGTVTNNGCYEFKQSGPSILLSTQVRFSTMRTIPTVTIYSTSSGASGNVFCVEATTDYSVSSVNFAGDSGFGSLSLGTSLTDANRARFHAVLNARM